MMKPKFHEVFILLTFVKCKTCRVQSVETVGIDLLSYESM